MAQQHRRKTHNLSRRKNLAYFLASKTNPSK